MHFEEVDAFAMDEESASDSGLLGAHKGQTSDAEVAKAARLFESGGGVRSKRLATTRLESILAAETISISAASRPPCVSPSPAGFNLFEDEDSPSKPKRLSFGARGVRLRPRSSRCHSDPSPAPLVDTRFLVA